jgi:hypothetical protein
MKTQLFLAALLLMAGVTRAQTTPTSPQRAGVGNQTTLPPTNPAMSNNPGTISQQSTDQQPSLQRNNDLDLNVPQGQTIDRNGVDQGAPRNSGTTDQPLRQRNTRRGTIPTRAVPPPQH